MGRTLHMNLKKRWFDMIFQGIKKEEYREMKESIVSILFDWQYSKFNRVEFLGFLKCSSNKDLFRYLKNFDTITFSNGYATDRPQFTIEFKGLEIKEGKKDWGAEDGVKYFTLLLGNIVKKAA